MKKPIAITLLLVLSVFMTNYSSAQEFKPTGGEMNVEVNFDPSVISPTIFINELRFRYFASPTIAYRLGVFVNSTNTEESYLVTVPNDELIILKEEINIFQFSIAPGIEKHFEGTDRLSPYVGAEIRYSRTSSEYITENLDNFSPTVEKYERKVTGGSSSIGMNLLVGADFYFSKHIYAGTELGLSFLSTTIDDDVFTNFRGPDTETETIENGKSFDVGLTFVSAIRVGFLF